MPKNFLWRWVKKTTKISPVRDTRDLYQLLLLPTNSRTFLWHLFLHPIFPSSPKCFPTQRQSLCSFKFCELISSGKTETEALATPEERVSSCSTPIKLWIYSPEFLKESVLNVHWKDWCWSWNSNTLATWCEALTHLKRPWCWERLKAGGEGDDRGWDGWRISLTQWTWVWGNSGCWWWTGKPGVLWFMGSQRVGHNWATELN